jgi:hypothetical protein
MTFVTNTLLVSLIALYTNEFKFAILIAVFYVKNYYNVEFY